MRTGLRRASRRGDWAEQRWHGRVARDRCPALKEPTADFGDDAALFEQMKMCLQLTATQAAEVLGPCKALTDCEAAMG